MPKSTVTRQVFQLLLPLYIPAFLFAFSHSLLIPILPLFAQGFDVPYAVVGLVLSADAVGAMLGDIPAGMLMRRMGQKTSMITGLVVTGISTALLFVAPSVPAVILLRIFSGMGGALFNVSRHFFLTEMTPIEIRGRLISLFGGVFRAGRMLGPVVGGYLGLVFGLRASFLGFGLACLAALLVVVFFLPSIEINRGGATASRFSPLRQLGAMLKAQRRTLATAGAGMMLIQLVRSGPPVILPLYAANALGLSVETIGIVMSVSAALDMALFYPAGFMMDRYGRKSSILSSLAFMVLGLALIPLVRDFYALLGVGLLAGFGNGLGAGAMLTLGADLAPPEGRSEFLGAWSLVGDVGSTTGPLAVGGLADWIPLAVTGWAIAGAGVLALFVFGLLVPETMKRAAPVSLPSNGMAAKKEP